MTGYARRLVCVERTSSFVSESSLEHAVESWDENAARLEVQSSKERSVVHVPKRMVVSADKFVWACWKS